MANKIESIPAAGRTFKALRDLGYDINSAVADIIDNSISRGLAKHIYVWFDCDNKSKFRLRVYDDGVGMTDERLKEAMRLGSSNDDYQKGDLSKYGMGMKTASLSQAEKLTVISKAANSPLAAYQWDMEHVNTTDKWELFIKTPDEIKLLINKLINEREDNNKVGSERDLLRNLFSKGSMTAVLWYNLQGFQKDFDSYTSSVAAQNYFFRTIDRLVLYIRLVFHRFLTGENGALKTSIFFNGSKLKALDPFCRNETHTMEMELSQKKGNYVIDKNLPPIVIKRYILPTTPLKPGNNRFSSVKAWEEAKGVLSWNESQGYYVYRNNRLINFGGWFRTKALDEHDKLARASIDLTEAHDELFTLDVKKTKIQFPELLKNHLVDEVNKGFIAAAKTRYAVSEKKENTVVNCVRDNTKKVSYLSAELVKTDNISVTEHREQNQIIIKNKYGRKISEDMTFRMLQPGQKIISSSFGDDNYFWKMIPNPNSDFQVLVNTDHPFYETVYGNSEKDKKVTAIMDAFLFTMSFIELKCITTNNEFLFEQMKEVASDVLKKFVDDNIL